MLALIGDKPAITQVIEESSQAIAKAQITVCVNILNSLQDSPVLSPEDFISMWKYLLSLGVFSETEIADACRWKREDVRAWSTGESKVSLPAEAMRVETIKIAAVYITDKLSKAIKK